MIPLSLATRPETHLENDGLTIRQVLDIFQYRSPIVSDDTINLLLGLLLGFRVGNEREDKGLEKRGSGIRSAFKKDTSEIPIMHDQEMEAMLVWISMVIKSQRAPN